VVLNRRLRETQVSTSVAMEGDLSSGLQSAAPRSPFLNMLFFPRMLVGQPLKPAKPIHLTGGSRGAQSESSFDRSSALSAFSCKAVRGILAAVAPPWVICV